MRLSEELEGFVLELRSRRRSPRTIEWYVEKVGRAVQEWEDPEVEAVKPAQIRAWLSSLTAGPETVRGYHRALCALLMWLEREGDLTANPIWKVRAPQVPKPVKERFSADEEGRLLAACGRDAQGIRNPAILLLMLDSGERAKELLCLTPADLHLDEGWVLVRQGKGAKGRQVPLSERTCRPSGGG